MVSTALESMAVLRFASVFLWADARIEQREVAFFDDLATSLGVPEARGMLFDPDAIDIDPTRVSPALATRIRQECLRAIASDGVVDEREMELFDLLDELLPVGT